MFRTLIPYVLICPKLKQIITQFGHRRTEKKTLEDEKKLLQ